MAAYLPVIKALLPYLAPLVSTAMPMFTKKDDGASADAQLQSKQIAELQEFVNKNAASVKLLAEQLEKAVSAIDEREATGQAQLTALNAQLSAIQQQQQATEDAFKMLAKNCQITKFIAVAALLASMSAALIALLK
jgi:TolA-binding protein